MKSLIVGAGGFVGGYLIEELLSQNNEVYATKLKNEVVPYDVKVIDLDITSPVEVESVLKEICPDVIYHLAAQSSVKISWAKPTFTANVNILGAINLFEGVKNICPNAKVVVIGSAEEYGEVDYNDKVSETTLPNPKNIYAVTKLTQEQIAKIYVSAYDLHIVMTRSFNHIGARQGEQFVVADFCSQVAKIENNLQEPIIRVGNLSAKRDFTDVIDVVKAYTILATKGIDGEVYNVGSGKAISIKDILDLILSMSKQKIEVVVDQNKFRPIDVPVIEADISKIKELGFIPTIKIEETIKNTLRYFREVYKR